MAQGTFNDGDQLSVIRGILNGNANDAETRLEIIERGNRVDIGSLSDIAVYLNAGTYELPSGHYEFTEDIDFGTADISLLDTNGCHMFSGSCLPVITYTGVTPFITNASTGGIVQINAIFVTTANATTVDLDGSGSLLLALPLFLNCAKAVNLNNVGFLTIAGGPIVGCGDGITANNVGTISARLAQFNDGQNIGGSYLTLSGASSERLLMSVVDSRPESTESFLNILANYGGDISIGTGVHKTGGGEFFKATGRDQTDVDIAILGVKNVSNSRNIAAGSFTGNSTETVIATQDVAVKIAATWVPILATHFTFAGSGTLTYTGKEDIVVRVSLITTVDVSGGGTKTVDVYIAKNGTVVTSTKGEAASSGASQVGSIALLELSTGDTLEGWVANATDSNNITVTTAAFDVTGVS